MKNMSKCEGTPKTLRIAVGRSIRQGLASIDRNDDEALAIIRDYLAQKFGVAYAKASNDAATMDVLVELWQSINKE